MNEVLPILDLRENGEQRWKFKIVDVDGSDKKVSLCNYEDKFQGIKAATAFMQKGETHYLDVNGKREGQVMMALNKDEKLFCVIATADDPRSWKPFEDNGRHKIKQPAWGRRKSMREELEEEIEV
jgi:hypothetical protein